jgi:hypothetical protein
MKGLVGDSEWKLGRTDRVLSHSFQDLLLAACLFSSVKWTAPSQPGLTVNAHAESFAAVRTKPGHVRTPYMLLVLLDSPCAQNRDWTHRGHRKVTLIDKKRRCEQKSNI